MADEAGAAPRLRTLSQVKWSALARGPAGGCQASKAGRRIDGHDHSYALGGSVRLGSGQDRQHDQAVNATRLFKNFNFRCTWADGWTNNMLKLDEYNSGPAAPYGSWVLLTKASEVEEME